MITIGVDPHKQTHTAAAIRAGSGEHTTPARAPGYDELLGWSWALDDERVWALEDCRHVSLWATSVLSLEQALAGFGDPTVIFIAALFVVSEALDATGVTTWGGHGLNDLVGDAGPRALLLALVVLVFVLGQLISNMATALIVIPIAVSAAGELDVSPKPVLVAVAVAAAAAFMTPVATRANLMVMEPRGYRFTDYWKLGLPLLALFGAVAVLLVPVFWSF